MNKQLIIIWSAALSVTLAGAAAARAQETNAPAPKHLFAAQELVKHLTAKNTSYEHGKPDMRFAAPYRAHADCSGFLDALLHHAYGYTPEQFLRWFGQKRPTADHYHDAIAKQEIFEEIKDFRRVRAGDFLAVKYKMPKEKSTGHVMLVAGNPQSMKARDPVMAETEQWEVPIIDSARSGHGKTDTRHGKGTDGKDHDGIGAGVLRVYTDGTGHIAGFTWSITGKNFLGQHEYNMVVGRLKSAAKAAESPIPAGRGELTFRLGKIKLKTFTFRPDNFDPKNGPMLLIFHGHGKNAEGYRNYAEKMAKHCHGLVISPLFDAEQFPRSTYSQGNVIAGGKVLPESDWTFSLIPRLIEAIRKIEERPQMPYYLFGHSGGGQFVCRLMAFVKLDPVEAVAANPGSVMFPTRGLPYPYGFGKLPAALAGDKQIKAYLACRLTLYAGTADTDPNHPQLDKSANAEKQGAFRLARAHNDFNLAHKVAKEENWKCNWRLVEAPDVDHSANKMLRHARCIDALFGRGK